ncbi:MAG: hypothetical protein KGJ07_02340 [Patescibacteria group bacterium]|nr:hypothetical protein [Patescibacteria group bacterium]MDE2589535.1 hypothetical protein [Patescibacteria group bacterium]
MKTERVVLSFIAVVIGLVVAGAAFFIYQSTKVIPPYKVPTITLQKNTPTPLPGVQLTIDQPADESVVSTRTITISGKTIPQATIVVNTDTDDEVVTPTQDGSYSLTLTIENGENAISVTAIDPTGNETTKIVTVTESSEDF